MAIRYVLGRVLAIIPVLLIVSIAVSLMVHFTPGDPVKVMLAQTGASAEEVEKSARSSASTSHFQCSTSTLSRIW